MGLFRLRRLLLFAILLIAGLLRLWRIDTLPPGFHFDEAFEGLEAWRILRDPTYRPLFLPGNFGVAPLNAYANALTFGLFEWLGALPGPTAMRVTAALFGTLGVGMVYLLADELRRLLSPRFTLSPAFPLWAAATLAVMRWHLHFSRMGIEPILVPALWAGATWLLLRGWRTGAWWNFAGCGLLLAACMYAYQGAWLIPLQTAGLGLLLLLRSPAQAIPPPGARSGLVVAGLVAAVVFAPLAWLFIQNPALVLTRPEQIAVVGNAASAPQGTLGEMVWATAKMVGPFGAPGDADPRRNVPGAPVLHGWLALLFYLGLGLALWQIRQPAFFIVLLSLVALLLPGVLSEYAPHFHRILGAAGPVALICAIGLDWIWRGASFGYTQGKRGEERGESKIQNPKPKIGGGLRWVALVVLVAGGVGSARDYFVRWAALPDLYHAFDEGLWQVGQQMADLPAGALVYLTPRTAEHPTIAFALQQRAAPTPVSFDGRHLFPLAADAVAQPEFYMVIEHEDFRTRLLLPELFPTATVRAELLDSQRQIYARLYERPAGTVAERPPQMERAVAVGDGIWLAGYDVQPATLKGGEVLYLQLHWLVETAPTADWTVFTHLVRREATGAVTVMAGRDSPPGAGSLSTTRWRPGWRILDEYQITIPGELSPGVYGLAIGLYQPSGERLPSVEPSILLGEVTLE
jgi:hypothetical protein